MPTFCNVRSAWAASMALCSLLTLTAAYAGPTEEDKRRHVLGQGKVYETAYYEFSGEKAGPTVLLQAGIHGDEVAGILALDVLVRTLKVQAGRVIVLPRMNHPAVLRGRRQLNVDLNRVFGSVGQRGVYEFELAEELTELVRREGVQYLVTLHESKNLYDAATNKGLGQTICYGVQPAPASLRPWIEAINKRTLASRRFSALYYPIPTSSTEFLVERFALAGGYCVETWSGFDLRERIALHLLAAEGFLGTVGIQFTVETRCPPAQRYLRSVLRAARLVDEQTKYLDCEKSIRPFLRLPW